MAERPGISLQVDLAPVAQAVGLIPPVLLAGLAEQNYDTGAFQRASVLKHVRQTFPAGRYAQAAVAAGIKHFGRRRADPQSIADVQGEVFAAGGPSSSTAFGEGWFERLEEGGQVRASAFMAIATAKRYIGRRSQREEFTRKLAAREYTIVRARGQLLIINTVAGGQRVGRGRTRGEASEVVGILRRHRTQRPLLKFYERWASVSARVRPKYDSMLEAAMTEAGRARLERKIDAIRMGRAAYMAELSRMLASGTKPPAARAAARAVKSKVRAAALSRGRDA